MNEEQKNAIRDFVRSVEREEIIKPFLRELADLLEKYEIVLEVSSEVDYEFPDSSISSLDILNSNGDVIYDFLCQRLSPDSIREEAKIK